MKQHLILAETNDALLLVDDTGRVQRFDFQFGLRLSRQQGALEVAPHSPFHVDSIVRSIDLPLDLVQLNMMYDESSQFLSIILNLRFPSTEEMAKSGGGRKVKFGSVDLTLSRGVLATTTFNLGEAETVHNDPPTALEWYILDLNQFGLSLELDGSVLRLSSWKLSQGDPIA